MSGALDVDRLQFAFTVTFHYIFPQLTMGLALLILILKTIALRTGDEPYNDAARFWARIFGINFALGVVTGIPMEFQFGTNWAAFSRAAGGVIGQPLAMEGIFSFFLESSFLGLFLFGEKQLGKIGHWFSALAVFIGSWLSGYLIIATNAWMQHPVGYHMGPHGEIMLSSFWKLLLNPWALWQYAHNMSAAVIRQLRDGGRRRVLPAFAALQRIRQDVRSARRDCRTRRVMHAAFPHRGRAGTHGRG
jgi:cytochrome bd ubiquinol oxidase subunit I